MKYPNLAEEKKLWKRGYEWVIGLDEAGRGPLAGPVTAAAVMVRQFSIFNSQFSKIRDSKTLTEKQREYFYEKLTSHNQISWAVGMVSEKEIDEINILNATKLAMNKAIDSLGFKNSEKQHLLIDGNFSISTSRLRQGFGEPRQKSIVKGDSQVFSIAAAGIIAKVTRDRMMKELHAQYPQYGFDRHKGYGTRAHLANLQKFGPCKIHRKTFYPVSALAKSIIS